MLKPRYSRVLLPALLAFLLLGLTLAVAQTGSSPEPPVLLHLRAGVFDPLREAPPLPGQLAALSPAPSPYAIVQFAGPVRAEWRAALEATGAQVMGYLPDCAYVIRLPAGGCAPLAHLPQVRWVGDLLPAYRLDPALWNGVGESRVPAVLTLTVQLFPGEDPDAVACVPGVQVLEVARSHWQTTLRLLAERDALPPLAALPGVRWIEPFISPRLANDVAAGLTGVVTAWTTLSLTGTGQIIAVADTGLDVGQSGTITDFAGRIVAVHSVGRSSTGEWDDPHGHGTHVAGSALGSGVLSGGQFRGAAPGAELVVQSLYSSTQPNDLYIPADLNLLFAPAYTDGARIHNDSWGSAGNRYDTWAQNADQFVWNHPDMLIVAAVGNEGIDRGADGLVDPGSLYTPATAKNVLAVGAAESVRAGQGYTGTYGEADGASFPANPVRDDLISDAPLGWGLAAFSSRGPTVDGRVRPDLVAPGTNIVSARSHHGSAAYPQEYDADYAFYSGSSQAAPLASGAAALVRQWYGEQGHADPSAALVRATLIHGASDLSPGQYGPATAGTVVVSDDVEGAGVWTGTLGGWSITDTYGYHTPDRAWVAQGTTLGPQRLDGTVDLGGTVSPTLLFWNRRYLDYSATRVYACGSQRVIYGGINGGRVGWALEAVDISVCAGVTDTLVRFEFQCTTPAACGADLWALDDITVADGAQLAEVYPRPDPGQGWGRLDLVESLVTSPPSCRWYADETRGLQTDGAFGYLLNVADGARPLRVTLVWSDYPALPAAAVALVNDLDLELEAPGGALYYPNGSAGPDRVNNVEQIEALSPLTGTYRLVVRGYNVPYGQQPYALLVTLGGDVLLPRSYLPLVARESP